MNKLFFISKGLMLLGAFFCFPKSTGKSSDQKIKPNILFIAVDDMNDWITPLGGRADMQTPNLDALAARGMIFTNAHCSAPACCPSRASIMTGVRPSTSGIYDNINLWRKSPVLKDAVTIPEYFRSQGYTVRGGGKIFHALSWIQTAYGMDQNDSSIWDDYFPSRSRSLPPEEWPESYSIDNNGTVTWDPVTGKNTEGRPPYFFDWGTLGEAENKSDYKVVDWAIGELNKKNDKPLFLAVGIFKPHIPWFAPQKYFDLYPVERIELPKILENDLDDVSPVILPSIRRDWHKWIIKNSLWRNAIQGYEACISFSDAMIGKLLKGLKESGNEDNTIIVLWSDHGFHLGEKEQWEKFTLWEEATKVPLIFVVPGITKASSHSSEAVSLLDVYPTLVDLTGGKVFEQLEGKSLKGILTDPSQTRNDPAITTWLKDNHSVRNSRYRYIRYCNGDEELYDHSSDPDEFYNLAEDTRNRALMDQLSEWLPKLNADEIK